MKIYAALILLLFLACLPIALRPSYTSIADSGTQGKSLSGDSGQAQNTDRKPSSHTEPAKARPRSSSPYDIALFLADNPQADLRDLWKQLGIHRLNLGYEGDEESDGTYRERFLSDCAGCEIETYAVELDGEPGREVLLKVSDGLAQSCRFLLFKQSKVRGKQEWRLLGHVDHNSGKYRMPEHSFDYCDRRELLVIKVQVGSGSGFSSYASRLFKVDSSGLKELLRFPSEGLLSICCSHPTKEFTTRIAKCDTDGNATTVELEFSVTYSTDLDSDKVVLWEKKQKAVYRALPKSNRLVLDPSKSDLTEEEIETIYAGDWPSNAEIIKYNFKELSEIASGEENKRKEWLRRFLDEGDRSEWKDSLRQLIKQ